MAVEPKTKYDRQLRIWGEQGQSALEKASICLLNCSPTGAEALKNLVLGGTGSITVVDGEKVEASDLGNNFLLDEGCLGQSRAKSVCSFLQELNDAVKVKFVEESPEALIDTNPSFFSQFTLVTATQMLESSLLKLDLICRKANVILVVARSYGLTGLVRISMKSSELRRIIEDSAVNVDLTSSDFWVLVAALKEFVNNEGGGEPPLEGSIPDMTSLTEYYVNLQKIYQAKAEKDCDAIESYVKEILKIIGRDPYSIPKSVIKTFCRNTRKLKVCRYHSIEKEFTSPSVSDLQKYLTDEDYSFLAGFYILLRAADRFANNYNRLPGVFDSEIEEDVSRLKAIAVSILNDLGLNGSSLHEDLVHEMCRYASAEIHAVDAFIGGVAAQEVIKLVTKQFIPLTGTLVFNGIDHKSQVLVL